MRTVRTVQNRFAYGRSSVNGSTPRIETQITYLRPMRSPTGPPMNVPAATAPRKTNRCSWALDGHAELVDQVERVVAAQAGQVEVFREDQHQQDAEATIDTRAGDSAAAGAGARADWRRDARALYQRPTRAADTTIAERARRRRTRRCSAGRAGTTMNAASSGPSAEPALPPT